MNLKIKFLTLAAAAALTASAQIAYKVEGNGLREPSVLFGTHHLAPLSCYTRHPEAVEGFQRAKRVVGEVDMASMGDPAVAGIMYEHMVAPADSLMSRLIPAERYADYDRLFTVAVAKTMPGTSLAALDHFKPQVAASLVAVAGVMDDLQDFNPEEQLDSWFQVEGLRQGKETVALETAEQQADFLYCSMPVAVQLEGLLEALDNPEKQRESARSLNAAYLAEDLDKLLELSKPENPREEAFMELLLDHRNEAWMQKLPELLGEGPLFVAVGALHLAGEKGLVEQLRRMGYTVTAIGRQGK